ncbi:uncharacterized protein AFUA_5G13770 [Aspergillus fumigatus Af293]|uniref:Uncharacterized protein n=1 Tax=Aspergillus fumigatus (strain ATCC MYA-4609 / CBS 101355 / FGSC A1100 / Af293) TaxID=330879 RepID=Q4WVY7_ASPFU|nr:hypothetical protein AFUA_5G13770 [Aspergillus fumigatus Af293]EAL91239.1 hypothetical protein AFUA_5G13770 [Aspergillus fumigatus Af293]
MSFPELTGNTFPRFGTTGFGEAMDADAETTFSIRMQPKQGRPGSNLDHEVRLSLKNAMVKFITLTTVQSYLGLEDVFPIWLPSIYVIVIVATLIYLGTSVYQSGNSPRANTLDGGKNVHSSVAALRQIILMPMHGCFSLMVINQGTHFLHLLQRKAILFPFNLDVDTTHIHLLFEATDSSFAHIPGAILMSVLL